MCAPRKSFIMTKSSDLKLKSSKPKFNLFRFDIFSSKKEQLSAETRNDRSMITSAFFLLSKQIQVIDKPLLH